MTHDAVRMLQAAKQEAGKKVLALPAAGQTEIDSVLWSCLDGLWKVLCRGSELRAGQPVVLAQALTALLGMWQVRPSVLHLSPCEGHTL